MKNTTFNNPNGLDEEEVEEVKKKGKRRSEVNPKTGSFAARDQDFYTRSMDLSEHDFELRDEIVEDNKEKRKILILVILIILVIIAIAALFILKKINVI